MSEGGRHELKFFSILIIDRLKDLDLNFFIYIYYILLNCSYNQAHF